MFLLRVSRTGNRGATCKTERFQAVQDSAQYRVVELVRTIGGQRKCFYSEFHALSGHQKQ